MSPFPEALLDIYSLLSCGISFLDSVSVWADQVSRNVPLWLEGRGGELPQCDPGDAIGGNPHGWNGHFFITATLPVTDDELDNIRAYRESSSAELAKVHEEWVANSKWPFEDWYKREIEGLIGPWIENFRRRVEERRILARSSEIFREWRRAGNASGAEALEELNRITASWAETGIAPKDPIAERIASAIERQMRRCNVAETELEARIPEYMTALQDSKLPFLTIGTGLWASLARKSAGGAKPPNRGTVNDFLTISTLLPYCDAMYVDRSCHGHLDEISRRGLVPFPTRIFSARNRQAFLDYLGLLESEAAPEHWEKLREVYGIGRTDKA